MKTIEKKSINNSIGLSLRKALTLSLSIGLGLALVACNQSSDVDKNDKNNVKMDKSVADAAKTDEDSTKMDKEKADDKSDKSETSVIELMSLSDKDGNEVKLSESKGKVVVVNFWASWCHVCRSEMPDMQKVYDKYKDNKDVVFYFADIQAGRETVESASKFMNDNNYSLPVYYDKDGKLLSAMGINSLPTTIVLDNEGKALPLAEIEGHKSYVHIGAITEDALEKHIETALAMLKK